MKIQFSCQDLDSLEVKVVDIDAPTLAEANQKVLQTFFKTRILSGKQLAGDVRELDGSTINTQRYLLQLASKAAIRSD